jgi:hypothetical protein
MSGASPAPTSGAPLDADDLPPEIERLFNTPQEQWGVDQWREYARWMQSSYVSTVESLSNTVEQLKQATELAKRGLRLEALMTKLLPRLERSLRAAESPASRREPPSGWSLADVPTPSEQVESAQAFLRQHLAKPIMREAYVRLREAKDPAVADWRGRMPAHIGQITFQLKCKLRGYTYPSKQPRRRGAPEKPDGLPARIARWTEEWIENKRSTGLKRSVRKIIRGFIDDQLKGLAKHVRDADFKTLYQQVLDARKKERRKLGKK